MFKATLTSIIHLCWLTLLNGQHYSQELPPALDNLFVVNEALQVSKKGDFQDYRIDLASKAEVDSSFNRQTNAILQNETGTWGGIWQGSAFGLNGIVNTLVVYQGELYAGGFFSVGSGKQLNNIARWNGTIWQAVGIGDENGVSSSVWAMAVYENELYVGGRFTRAGGVQVNRIARWNGTNWNKVGEAENPGFNNTVTALLVYKNELYAGGLFTQAAGKPMNRISRWNGTAWESVGLDEASSGTNNSVLTLTEYKGDLIAGGSFTMAGATPANRIARWNGTGWFALNDGEFNGITVGSSVSTLSVFQDQLYAGGIFGEAGGKVALYIARWDGRSWSAVGPVDFQGTDAAVTAMIVHDNSLYIGGQFTIAGGISSNYVAKWDGNLFERLGSAEINGASAEVRAFTVFENELVVGGIFIKAGETEVNHIARWNGNSWIGAGSGEANGVPGEVSALTVFNRELYVAGSFVHSSFYGRKQSSSVLKWDGANLQPVGSGSGTLVNGMISAMVVYKNALYIGGNFTQVNGQMANGVAYWDGFSWKNASEGILSSGPIPMTLTVYNNELYAGGRFQKAGGIDAQNIARWNGTSWQTVLMPGSTGSRGVHFSVNAMVVFNNELVVGGSLALAGEIPVSNIAKWNGTNWFSLGAGIDGEVYSLAVYRNELFAGGDFFTAGTVKANYIARWNGSEWNHTGPQESPGTNHIVSAMAEYQNELYAAGSFSMAGNTPGSGIARWNGLEWKNLSNGKANGVNSTILALSVFDDVLYAGGNFKLAGGEPAGNLATWFFNPTSKEDHIPGSIGQIALFQNYPNPFNPATSIRFELPNQQLVSLSVYNLAGQKVAVVVNEIMSAGTHSVNFDASTLSSGIYIYILQSVTQKISRKMILLK